MVSDKGFRADAYIGTIHGEQLRAATTAQPVLIEDFTISPKMKFETGDNNGQANGIVFARSGALVIQTASVQHMLDPVTFQVQQKTAALNNQGTSAGSGIIATDLAGFSSPPTVEVVKHVMDRRESTDQFRLGAGKDAASAQSVITNGVDGDVLGIGRQSRTLGPIGVLQDTVMVVGEEMAPGSGTADISAYDPTFACTNLNTGDPVMLSGDPEASSRSFAVPAVGAQEWQGPRVECVITNDGRIPRLVVDKSATPTSGSPVQQGDVVTYSLSFDNRTGTADATGVQYIDHLADVLDDADLDETSIKVTDVTHPEAPVDVTSAFFASFDAIAQQLNISGAASGMGPATVPAGKQYLVSYSVTVKPNIDADGKPRTSEADTTAYLLSNFLLEPGIDVPESCDAPVLDVPAICTEHQVRSWTASKKDSRPANGATLHAGGNVYYSLEVKKNAPGYAIEGITVTDDLTDVLKLANWDAGAPNLSDQGARSRGIYFFDEGGAELTGLAIREGQLPSGTTLDDWVPAPSKSGERWELTTAAFDLPEGAARAEVWFAVGVKKPLSPETPAGTTFKNTFSAAAAPGEPPADQCRTGVPAGGPGGHAEACEVTHLVGEDFFTIRKDGRGTLEDGTTMGLINLIGHEFELRADAGGSMGEVPGFMCEDWNQAPNPNVAETCGRFFPIPTGAQAGRWRAENIAPGTYWLLETKAPNAQRLGPDSTRPVTGVQLLAEPVKFRVASESDAGVPAPGSPERLVVAGQIDIFAPDGSLLPRHEASGAPNKLTAVVNPTGYLMLVNDPGLLPLPLSGGLGVNLLTLAAVLVIVIGGSAAVIWRRQRDRVPGAPTDPH